MIYQFQLISWILLVTTLINVFVIIIAWQRRNQIIAKYLIILASGAALWSFSSIFETAATDISHVLIWAQISYLGITIVPLAYFLLALAYGQHYKYITQRNIVLLSIVPLFTLLMVATQNWHHAWYTSISIDSNTNMPIYGYSIWFWLYTIYSYLLLAIGVVVLIKTILSVPSRYKSQIITVIVGAVLPFTGNIIYVFKINPVPGLDWTPIAFGLSGLFLTWGILGFQLLNLVPIARNKLVEAMKNGVLVTDYRGKILDFNPAMQAITGITAKNAIGQNVIQTFSNWEEFINCYDVKTEIREEICLLKNETTNYYDLQITLLYSRHQGPAGQIITLHDITEQKQIEEELNRSKERFKQVAENAQEWIWEVNAQGQYTYASPVAKDIIGYDVEEIVGKKYFYDFFPENDRENLKEEALNIFAKKQSFTKFENVNIHKNGRVVYLSTSGVPVLDKYGSLLAYRGSDTDITEQKQADLLQSVVYQISEATQSADNLDALYKSIHSILKQVLDVTNFYIAQYDEKTKLLSFPFDRDSEDEYPTTARPLGNGITEYMIKTGRPLLLNKNDIEEYKRKGKFEAIGALSEQWMGSPLRVKNKVIGVIAVNSYHDPNLYTNSDLKILTFVAEQVARAIEHKQSITDLEVEKTYLDELFTSSPEALALVTTDSTILHVNEQFTSLFGFDEGEVFGRNIDDLLVASEDKKKAQKYTQEVATGKRMYFEALRKKKDGSTVHVSVLSSPVNYKGDVLAVYAAYRDITDRIKAADRLKKSEEKYRSQSVELSESNSMKAMLLDVIAHDLRNPAGVIKGFAEFGLEMDPNNEILKEIDGGVDNLLNVISDATTLSKVALGDKINKEELDLVSVIRVAIDESSSQLQFAKIKLDLQIEEKLKVIANPIICEIFRNYISNAIKYAEAGKKIVIDAVVEDDNVTVNVKDYGETIKQKERENVFIRNVQLGKTKGRGLGLAIVKRIADAHDAQVGVKPNEPKGNVFYLKLPLVRPK